MGNVNGRWWPIYVPDIHGPRASQHPFDPYSFTHILHGFLCFLFIVTIPDAIFHAVKDENLPWWWIVGVGALVGAVFETSWEIIENTECVLARFRRVVGVSRKCNSYTLFFFAQRLLCTVYCVLGLPLSVA